MTTATTQMHTKEFLAKRADESVDRAERYIAAGWVIVQTHAPIFSTSGRVGCTCEEYYRSDKCRDSGNRKYDPQYVCPNPGKHPYGKWKDITEVMSVKKARSIWGGPVKALDVDTGQTVKVVWNMGVLTGPSGLLTLDADTYKSHYQCDLADLIPLDDQETPQQFTHSGGLHFVFDREGKPYTNANGELIAAGVEGVDIRGVGGFQVIEPSIGPSGNPYAWGEGYEPWSMRPHPIPSDLDKLLAEATGKRSQPCAVNFDTPTTDAPDLAQWALPHRILDLLHDPPAKGQRSQADQRVITALVYAGASNNAILAFFEHFPIGTRGKFAESGRDYLAHSIGKARAYVMDHPGTDTENGAYDGFAHGAPSGVMNGSPQTGAELIADVQTATKGIDPDTGEILDSGGAASVPFQIVNKNRSMLRGYGYTDDQINAMTPSEALTILNSKRDDDTAVGDQVAIDDVLRFGSPKYHIGQKVNYWSLDNPEAVEIFDAGVIESIKCGEKGWEYTTTRAGIKKEVALKPLVDLTTYSMELPSKLQKVEPIPLPDVSAAPDLPEWAKLTPQELEEAATTGKFLRDYIEFAKDASPMTPVEFNISAGLAAVAVAIARRVHVRVGASKIYPNLYQIYVGPSTLQRKTTGMNTLTRLMELAGMVPIFTLAETQTPEAFVEDMTLNIPSTYPRMSPTARQVWLDRRRLYSQRGWVMDEASRLLDSFNREYTAGLLPIVLDLYDSKDRSGERNTKSWGNESIEKSYLNIFGATTFSSISKHVADPERWGDGFFARFSFTASNEPGAWQFWPEPMDYPKRLVDELHRIAFKVFGAPPLTSTVTNTKDAAKDDDDDNEKKPPTFISIEVDPLNDTCARFGPGAWDIWERYSKAVGFDMLQQAMTDNSIPVEMFPSYGRLGTMMIKVAMLFAVMDSQTTPVTIERKHVAAAMRIVEMWRNSLHIVKAGGQVTAAKTFVDKVLATLSKNGTNWTIRRDLQHALGCSWAELEPAINDLHGNGLIERVPSPQKRGPKSEMYRVVVLS